MMLKLGSRTVTVNIERRHTSRLSISVYPDFRVAAVAPYGFSEEEIEHRILRRAFWIERQLLFFESYLPREPERRFVSGESHRYMGRQYRLKMVVGEPESVKLKGRYLWVWTKDAHDRTAVRDAVQSWYAQRCHSIFRERLEKCYQRAAGVLKIPMPHLYVRQMSKRWGSYTATGRLLLNIDLIKMPRDCIDYVIMHELCHARQPNHSAKFERLLSRVMPDWRERRQRLDREQ